MFVNSSIFWICQSSSFNPPLFTLSKLSNQLTAETKWFSVIIIICPSDGKYFLSLSLYQCVCVCVCVCREGSKDPWPSLRVILNPELTDIGLEQCWGCRRNETAVQTCHYCCHSSKRQANKNSPLYHFYRKLILTKFDP